MTEAVEFIEPKDESDQFCTCPHQDCLTLGTHTVRPQFTQTAGWHVVRTCRKCGHEWHTAMDEPPPPTNDSPLTHCIHCGLYSEHELQVTTLNESEPATFKGEPTGAWSISGPDGEVVAIRRCSECKRMWHTTDG